MHCVMPTQKLIKRCMRMAKDWRLANKIKEWMMIEKTSLMASNQKIIDDFWETLPQPVKTNYFDWTIIPENGYIYEERIEQIQCFMEKSDWDANDNELALFWKRLAKMIFEFT